MQIREDRYFRGRNGVVYGPMVAKFDGNHRGWTTANKPDVTWLDSGAFIASCETEYDLVEEVIVFPVREGTDTSPSKEMTESEGFMLEFADQAGHPLNDDDVQFYLFRQDDLIKLLRRMGAGRTWLERIQDMANDMSHINNNQAVTAVFFMNGKTEIVRAGPHTDMHGKEQRPAMHGMGNGEALIQAGAEIIHDWSRSPVLVKMETGMGTPRHLVREVKVGDIGERLDGRWMAYTSFPFDKLGAKAPEAPSELHPIAKSLESLGEVGKQAVGKYENFTRELLAQIGKSLGVTYEMMSADHVSSRAEFYHRLAEAKTLIDKKLSESFVESLGAFRKAYAEANALKEGKPRTIAEWEAHIEADLQRDIAKAVREAKEAKAKITVPPSLASIGIQGLDKHDRPIVGSVWRPVGEDALYVVKELYESSYMPGKWMVLFGHAYKKTQTYRMGIENWLRRYNFVHYPIPASAKGHANIDVFTGLPRRVFFDGASAYGSPLVRVSKSGKTIYPMSKEFVAKWDDSLNKFPPLQGEMKVRMTVEGMKPENLKAAFLGNTPKFGVTLHSESLPEEKPKERIVTVPNVRLSFNADLGKPYVPAGKIKYSTRLLLDKENRDEIEKVLSGIREAKLPSRPVDVYYDADRKWFFEYKRNTGKGGKVRALPRAFVEKWIGRKDEFARMSEVLPMRHHSKAVHVEAILSAIISYLHEEDRQSKPVRDLLNKARELGLKL